ncbi:hypothetical protein DQ04_14261000 [Trypanosoma grayi]|uniref:hypothetical protein n=1 Tax=Trypanosoma grayi TaxID=71804 RepID=UPI0004F46BB8|nr:hypothetical protein DQ04_14261000 [Trypanosoma grayi]KEG06381.1 hypothetical protein DQ04_14261000 [Trypanosoma grayi]
MASTIAFSLADFCVASTSLVCVQLWMMPFMSRYRLSTGGGQSRKGVMTDGQRSATQRKNFGTPIASAVYL